MIIFDNPATVPAPAGGYSHVARVELGDRTLLQLSGQVAIDADRKIVGGNDMAAQAEFIMDNITAILAAHGASLADVVNIRTFPHRHGPAFRIRQGTGSALHRDPADHHNGGGIPLVGPRRAP